MLASHLTFDLQIDVSDLRLLRGSRERDVSQNILDAYSQTSREKSILTVINTHDAFGKFSLGCQPPT